NAMRYRRKKCIAVPDREGLACRRGAGIHDQRPRIAKRFRIGPHTPQSEVTPIKVELLLRRPDQLDDVEPFLRVFLARLMIAQCRADHLKLALFPAAHEVEAETSLADVVGGDELLGGYQRWDQRRVHGSEHDEPLCFSQ